MSKIKINILLILLILTLAHSIVTAAEEDDIYSPVVWSASIPSIAGLAWSPDSSLLAVASGQRVYVFNSDGDLLWSKPSTEGIFTVAWSPDSKYLAIGIGRGSTGGVVVYSKDGDMIWSRSTDFAVFSLSWRADGKLSAGGFGGHIITYDRYGHAVWSLSGLPGDVTSIDWDPAGTRLVAVTFQGSVVFVNKYGSKILQNYLGGTLYSAKWSHKGNVVVLGGAGKLYFYSSDGSKRWSVSIDPTTKIKGLDWSPGDRMIAIAATTGSGTGYLAVYDREGRELWIYGTGEASGIDWSDNGFEIAVSANSSSTLLVYGLSRLVITGPPGSSGELKWEDHRLVYTITNSGTAAIYLFPGNYTVYQEVKPYQVKIGDLSNMIWKKTIKASALATIRLTVPDENSIPKITVTGIPGAQVKFTWSSGSWTTTIPPGGSITVTAAPGTYTVYYSVQAPRNYVGVQTVIHVAKTISLGFWDKVKINASDPSPVLGKLEIEAHSPVTLALESSKGLSKSFNLSKGTRITIYTDPGIIRLSYRIEINGTYIGPSSVIERSMELNLNAASERTIIIPSLNSIIGYIDVKSSCYAEGFVAWNLSGKTYSVNLSIHSPRTRLYAAPGTYRFHFKIVPKDGLIIKTYIISRTVSVNNGSLIKLVLPGRDAYGVLEIMGHPGIRVLINGTRIHWDNLGSNSSLKIYLLPGNYIVGIRPAIQGEVIGPSSHLWINRSVTIKASETLQFEAPTMNSIPELQLRAPPGSTITISWDTGSKEYTVPTSGLVGVKLAPGNYKVVVSYYSTWRGGSRAYQVNLGLGDVKKLAVKPGDFPYTKTFYLVLSAIIALILAASLAFYNAYIRPNPALIDIDGVLYVTGGGEIILKIRNKGIKPWRGRLKVILEDKVLRDSEIDLAGKEAKTIRIQMGE